MSFVIETKSDKPKNFVVLTLATSGTLGDASAAAQFVTDVKKKQGAAVKFTVVLAFEEGHQEQTCSLFEDLDITLLPLSRSVRVDDRGNDELTSIFNDVPLLEKLYTILHGADNIMVFPATFLIDVYMCMAVQTLINMMGGNQQKFLVSEHNWPIKVFEVKKAFGNVSTWVLKRTGLGKDDLGVFCTLEKDASNNANALSEISGTDKICVDLLLAGTDAKNYHESHQLFFGYYNQTNEEVQDSLVEPLAFIESSLVLSAKTKTIDFVLPLRESPNPKKDITQILEHFSKVPYLKDYQLEFWRKQNGKMICLKTGGGSGKKIRFINGFPFTEHTMGKLMKASDNFVLVSGDGSFSRGAISHYKIFLYQTMRWKVELRESFIALVKEQLGENSELYQFFNMQKCDVDSRKPEQLKQLQVLLFENKKELVHQMQAIREYIFHNKNLYHTLFEEIISYSDNSAKYIEDCLKNVEDTDDIESMFPLLKMYPNEMKTICEILSKQNKRELLEKLDVLQKNIEKEIDNFVKIVSNLETTTDDDERVHVYNVDLSLIAEEYFNKFCVALAACEKRGVWNIVFHRNPDMIQFDLFSLNDERLAIFCKAFVQSGVNILSGDIKPNLESITRNPASLKEILQRLPEDIRLDIMQKANEKLPPPSPLVFSASNPSNTPFNADDFLATTPECNPQDPEKLPPPSPLALSASNPINISFPKLSEEPPLATPASSSEKPLVPDTVVIHTNSKSL